MLSDLHRSKKNCLPNLGQPTNQISWAAPHDFTQWAKGFGPLGLCRICGVDCLFLSRRTLFHHLDIADSVSWRVYRLPPWRQENRAASEHRLQQVDL